MLKTFLKSTWFYLGVIALLAIPLCARLFGPDLIDTHDSMAALIRALSMEKYMGHGQFLVRWAPEINGGYGYPMFNFYPPLFSFISVFLFQLTHHMVLAMNWACVILWVLSGTGMFMLSREYWGSEGALLSAVLYMYAPYHMVDIYVRGAYAEFTAFALFPFLLFSIFKLSQRTSLGYILLGVGSVFALSLAHNIMTMLFFPIAAAYMLYLYVTGHKLNGIYVVIAVFVIGLMMSSFFWLPAFVEKKFLNLSFLISMRYDFHKSFITMKELFWPWNKDVFDNVSFQIGVVHTLLCLMSVCCLPKIFKINKQLGLGFIFFLIIAVIAVFLTLSCSHLLWENIHVLSFIQFPWRILAIIVFAMSFLGGSISVLINNPVVRRVLLIIVGLSAILIYYNASFHPSFVDKEKTIENFVAMGEGEYTPRWVKIPPGSQPNQKFSILQGQGQFSTIESNDPVDYSVKVVTSQSLIVSFNSFYFPGWRVLIDGQDAEIHPDNPYGLILFAVPPGEHSLRVYFGSTPIRTTGTVISWAGLIFLICLCLYSRRKTLNA